MAKESIRPPLSHIQVSQPQELHSGDLQCSHPQPANSPLITPASQLCTPMWPDAFRWSNNGFGGLGDTAQLKGANPPRASLDKNRYGFSLPSFRRYGQPPSPSRCQKSKTKIRRMRSFSRSSSLTDDKMLLQSKLVRSQSSFQLLEHFVQEGIVGRSKHSEVCRVRHRTTGELYAVKRSTRRFASKAHRDRCMHEMAAVSSLPEHPNIVAYYRAWQQAAHFYIQMALCEGGSLADLIEETRCIGEQLEEQRIWQILSDLFQGLQFLHSNNILHLDIKPDNIFLDSMGRCKIGDFGLAIKDHEEEWLEGDGNYLAPELLTSDEPTFAADIYSAGATIFECCTGHLIPSEREELHAVNLGVSAELQTLVRSMLDVCPSNRPTAEEVNKQVAQLWSATPLDAAMEGSNSGSPNEQPKVPVCAGLDTPEQGEQSHQLGSPRCQVSQDGHCLIPATPHVTPSLQPIPTLTACTPAQCRDLGEEQESPIQPFDARKARLEDTAFLVGRQQSRDHWSGKENTNLKEADASSKTPVQGLGKQAIAGHGRRFDSARVDKGKESAYHQPATIMRSPFEELAFQDEAEVMKSPSQIPLWHEMSPCQHGRRAMGELQTRVCSFEECDSIRMDDLQSTVRLLSMSFGS